MSIFFTFLLGPKLGSCFRRFFGALGVPVHQILISFSPNCLKYRIGTDCDQYGVELHEWIFSSICFVCQEKRNSTDCLDPKISLSEKRVFIIDSSSFYLIRICWKCERKGNLHEVNHIRIVLNEYSCSKYLKYRILNRNIYIMGIPVNQNSS